ncbi:MAG: hypothetical protein ACREIS_12365 [Nitrospiraceae bacterium]
MRFDPALAAQEAFRQAETRGELGPDWPAAVEAEETFSSSAGAIARQAYELLLSLASRYPAARSFQAFCIYSTWQQVTEETIPHHFRTGAKLCELYLASPDGADRQHFEQVRELYDSFRAGLGLEEENEHHEEHRRDTVKGGD